MTAMMLALMFIIIIYTAHLMWLCIERPMRRFLRGEWGLAKNRARSPNRIPATETISAVLAAMRDLSILTSGSDLWKPVIMIPGSKPKVNPS